MTKNTRDRPAWQLPLAFAALPWAAYLLNRVIGVDSAPPSPWASVALGLSAALLQLMLRGKPGDAVEAALNPEVAPSEPGDQAWAWGGLAALLAALAFLTIRQPFYFSQDDNYVQFLPKMLVALRGAFAEGRFPDFDPYHFGGSPLAELGTYALTYPLTWFSYLLARFGLGHDTWTIEVFAWLHLLGGYAAFLWAARLAGAATPGRVLGALAFTLGGYNLVVGRSWYYMLPWALWLPVLFGGLLALKRQMPAWQGVLAIAAALGLGFHSGNIQIWAYALGFALLLGCAWTLSSAWTKRSAMLAACAALAGLGMALPLLWVQLHAVEGNLVIPAQGGGPGNPLRFLLPWMQAKTASLMPTLSSGHPKHAGVSELLDMGTLLPLLTLLALPAVLMRKASPWRFAWPLLAALAWALSLGPEGGLWGLQTLLGPAKGFQHPIKALLFFQFFCALGGAVLLPRLLITPQLRAALLALSFGALAAHVWRSDSAFYLWAEPAYPPLPQELSSALPPTTQRLAGVSPRWMHKPGYASWMVHNLPGVYGHASLLGYDPLVSAHKASHGANPLAWADTEAGLRAWGVASLLIAPTWKEVPGTDPTEAKLLQWASAPGRNVRPVAGLWLVDVPQVEPLAATARGALPVRFDVGGASVELDGKGGPMRVATPAWPRWKAHVDGAPIAWSADPWGRVQIIAPAGAKALRLEYAPDWGAGLWMGLFVLALAGLGLRRLV